MALHCPGWLCTALSAGPEIQKENGRVRGKGEGRAGRLGDKCWGRDPKVTAHPLDLRVLV